jgi:hypothetical protein
MLEPIAGKANLAWTSDHPVFDSSRSGRTNPFTWDEFSAQFEAVARPLAEIRAALQFPPRYFYDNPTNLGGPQSPFVKIRTAAQWLMGDAINALHSHDLDRTREDLVALAHLAALHREDRMLISQMIRIAVAGLGCTVT